jgi:hypothetical protein
MGADLERDGGHEHESGEPCEEERRDHEPGPHAAVLQQRRRHERVAMGALEPPLDQHECRDGGHDEREQRPAPRGPAEAAALGEGDEQRQDGGAEKRRAGHVDRRRLGRAGGGHVAPRERHGRDPDGDVHEEDRPPALAGDVRVDDHAAGHLADDGRDPRGGAVEADCPRPFVADRRGLDGRERLRHHERGGRPLGGPERDQHLGRRRDAAQEREHGKRRRAGHEQRPPPEQVAEPAAQHEHQRVRDAVAGDDQLERSRRGMQVGIDGGQGDVDDEEVGDGDECAKEHRGQADR